VLGRAAGGPFRVVVLAEWSTRRQDQSTRSKLERWNDGPTLDS
jgi:hypothetical protein